MQRTEWVLDRTEAVSEHGMVAAKHELAAEVGIDVLQAGGNVVDAAVATAFAVGVVEPFMSGIGGGGLMVIHLADRRENIAIDYGMVAPKAARPDLYELVEGDAVDTALFGWRAVRDDANIVGPLAIAVPGTVAGLALAAERYGTLPLRELIRPAARLARDGFPVGWHTSLTIAQDLALLNRFPATRAIFTDDGRPWTMLTGLTPTRLVQADLARTLDALADDGWETFYRGDLARTIVDGVRGMGGLLADKDLRDYAVRVGPALMSGYRGHAVATAQAPSGGTTLLESLRLMEQADLAALGHNTADALHHLIESFRQAFVDRFAYLADPRFVQVPEAALLAEGYARSRAAAFGPSARPVVAPGGRDELGVRHALARSVPAYGAGEHTTHVSVVDARGNAVALTQTLLSSWGSRVVAPGTGVLLNNGMMWFDPEPGRPNSVAGGKRPLANMTPALVLENDDVRLAVGAMGGRKIINAVTQVIANVVDYGMGIQAAITAPRVDCSTAVTLVSSRINPTVVAALERRGHALQAIREDIGSVPFASPVGILRAADGTLHGGANPYYPAMAIGL